MPSTRNKVQPQNISHEHELDSKGVYQLANGAWAYRFCKSVNGKNVYKRASTDRKGNPLLTQRDAMLAREEAMLEAQGVYAPVVSTLGIVYRPSATKEDRTVWYSEVDGSLKIQVQVKNPDEDTTYQNYLQERKERVELLRKSGMPFSKAYKETVCFLWEKYHRIYYYCYTLVSNAIHVDELIEILRAAIQDDIL